MAIYLALIARLSPLLLMMSALLVGTRWLHDRYVPRHKVLGTILTAAYMLGGMAAIIPFAVRMSTFFGAQRAANNDEWDLADQRVTLYQAWGGTLTPSFHYVRGVAAAKRGDFRTALAQLQASLDGNDPLIPKPLAVYQLGACHYVLGDYDLALQVLRKMPEGSRYAQRRDYLIGRIAEKRGDVATAAASFERSLAEDSEFTPALYRLLRLDTMRGDAAAAHKHLAGFRRNNPRQADAPYLTEIEKAIDRREVLVDFEPFRLE